MSASSRNFHERLAGEEVPLPSERSTGLVFAAVAAIVAVIYRADPVVLLVGLVAAALLAGLGLGAPHVLRPLNVAWFKLGLLLGRIVSPVVMLALFLVTIVPFGLVMQLRYDPLRRQRKPDGKTYWIERGKNDPPQNMTNQF